MSTVFPMTRFSNRRRVNWKIRTNNAICVNIRYFRKENASNYEDNQLLMTDGKTLAYNQVVCENTASQNKTYVLPQKKNFREI